MKNILLEDVAYGIYDRPGPTGSVADAEKKEEDTVPDSVPVVAANQMSTQLSVERPPIEDEDYSPSSVEELSRAASAISKMVPTSQIEFYYKQLHSLLDDATDREGQASQQTDTDRPDEKKDDEVKKEAVHKKIRNVLKEMLSDEDRQEFEKYRTGGIDYFGGGDKLPVSTKTTDEPEEGKTLEQVAAAFGDKVGKIANEQTRVLQRMQYFIQNVKDEDLQGLVEFATGEYVDVLLQGGFIDEEDVKDLKKMPPSWFRSELPSFGFFFVQSFVLPAYREIVREATEALKLEIEKLEIPEVLHQTVYNQVTGATERKPEVIVRKLEKLIKNNDESKRITPQEAIAIVRKIEKARPRLADKVQYSDDLVQRSLEKWNSSSKGARVKALTQALENTDKENIREKESQDKK